MTKVLITTLALVALAVFSDPAVAEQKETAKSPPTGAATGQAAAGQNTVDRS